MNSRGKTSHQFIVAILNDLMAMYYLHFQLNLSIPDRYGGDRDLKSGSLVVD
jgi:hypothetical protein